MHRVSLCACFTLSFHSKAAPLHWIYDQQKVKDITTKSRTIEFYPESQCPFYTIETGRTSAYGDQLYETLKNVAENKGESCDPHVTLRVSHVITM